MPRKRQPHILNRTLGEIIGAIALSEMSDDELKAMLDAEGGATP